MTSLYPTSQHPKQYECKPVQHVKQVVIFDPPDGKSWKTITPKLSETSPDIIIVDLNKAGIEREFNQSQEFNCLSNLSVELRAL